MAKLTKLPYLPVRFALSASPSRMLPNVIMGIPAVIARSGFGMAAPVHVELLTCQQHRVIEVQKIVMAWYCTLWCQGDKETEYCIFANLHYCSKCSNTRWSWGLSVCVSFLGAPPHINCIPGMCDLFVISAYIMLLLHIINGYTVLHRRGMFEKNSTPECCSVSACR